MTEVLFEIQLAGGSRYNLWIKRGSGPWAVLTPPMADITAGHGSLSAESVFQHIRDAQLERGMQNVGMQVRLGDQLPAGLDEVLQRLLTPDPCPDCGGKLERVRVEPDPPEREWYYVRCSNRDCRWGTRDAGTP